MKVCNIMSRQVISIDPEETVEVAARQLAQYNIGVLPVTRQGKLCGMVTDRDLVTRCMAPGRKPAELKVKDVMTGRLVTVGPDAHTSVAANLMGREQVRRLPVVENGKLCGMVTLGDLAATEEGNMEAADALQSITSNICKK